MDRKYCEVHIDSLFFCSCTVVSIWYNLVPTQNPLLPQEKGGKMGVGMMAEGVVDGYYTSSLLPGITKKLFFIFFGTYYHQKGETERKGEHQSRSRAPLYISRCVYTRTEVVVVGGGEKR